MPELPPLLQPIATSTPAHTAQYHSSLKQQMADNENHVHTNRLTELNNSKVNNEANFNMKPEEPVNVLPVGVASNHVLSVLEETIPEKSTIPKHSITSQGGNSTKENSDRLNRSHFFLKNIVTSVTCMDVFISIVTQYPLVQLSTIQNSSKIQYLCVADTSTSSNEKLVSMHLSFEKKVNFKHKFLNHLFPDLKISDYLFLTNGDHFNAEIKSSSQGRYIESSIYTSKKEKNAPTDVYRQKQKNAASAALKQESLPSAVAILRESLPFEYITCGNQMRSNIEYELQAAEKQREIGYKPVHDSASFKIPEEHREKIDEWLIIDFQKRIDEQITRSRCLFLVGPTQHGI
ncbi:unnamed protein product [Rotaria magnacalcarata]|uniref:Uncharacterized protein n=2 Tax=Rotaria magnacalcarata TaxID=392030 RepID=A0A815TH41_9BILA|nr:unnamed protein product [Rotaria magnacalcarata]